MRASLRDGSRPDPLAARRHPGKRCQALFGPKVSGTFFWGGWQGAGPTQVEAERAGMDPPANVLWRGESAPAENSAGATRRGAPSDAEARSLTGPAHVMIRNNAAHEY